MSEENKIIAGAKEALRLAETENAYFAEKRIGDMSREELLLVISHFHRLETARKQGTEWRLHILQGGKA